MIYPLVTYEMLREALQPLPKPCAFLHVESLNRNIEAILQMSGNKRIRIASKSIRSLGILKKIMEHDDRFQGVMCFTASEAIYLYEHGFDDLLVAYPTWDEQQLREVCRLVIAGATITLMIDSQEHVNRLSQIASEEQGTFLVAIDIDLSSQFSGIYFGVYRSPLRSVASVIQLVQDINDSSYLKLDGVMGYEAQIAGVVDKAPKQRIKNSIVRFLKRRSLKEISEKRYAIMKALNREGVSLRFVNGGGTGSLTSTQKDPHVTEVTAGSGFYTSHLFDKYENLDLKPAVFFAAEITRQPEPNLYTCAGGGYVASGAAGIDKLPEVYLPKGAKLMKNEAVGEVQTPVIYDGAVDLTYGDPIILRHSKAGEVCERFLYLYLIENNKVTGKETTYRGDGKCFL